MSRPAVGDCAGCRNDFYNGHNDLGVKQCWSLKGATMVAARDVHINRAPPFLDIPLTTKPSCYQAQGFARVKPESLTADGFWK